MYRRSKYNLNTMSHDTAIDLVKSALDKEVQVSEIYVDTIQLDPRKNIKPNFKKNPSVKNFFVQTSFTNKENRNPKSSRCKLVKDRNVENVSLASFLTRP